MVQIRQSFNAWGALVGFLIGLSIMAIGYGFFKLTWGFWENLAGAAFPDSYDGLFKLGGKK